MSQTGMQATRPRRSWNVKMNSYGMILTVSAVERFLSRVHLRLLYGVSSSGSQPRATEVHAHCVHARVRRTEALDHSEDKVVVTSSGTYIIEETIAAVPEMFTSV